MIPRFDVAVVGGGSAGVAAALSAARLGARTLLVERSRALGGNASDANVHTICGLYRAAAEGDAVPAHAGFAPRFAAGLRRAGGAGPPERAGPVWVLPIVPPRLARYAAALCGRATGLQVRTRCELTGAALAPEPGALQRLDLSGDGGAAVVEAAALVDASGDAALASLGGADVAAAGPDELQLPSYIFRMDGVEAGALAGFGRLRLTRAVARAARGGTLPPGCESLLVRPGAAPDEAYVTLNLPRPEGGLAPLDAGQRAALEERARRWAACVASHLRDTRPEFRRSRILAWPRRVGIRETRRLVGRETVTREDVLRGRRRDDGVAWSTWPIELWQDHRRARFEQPEGAASVPLGALVSRSHPRLAAAGRCLSATHEALGALRVIGTALATGEAAGIAAALAADRGCALAAVEAREVGERAGEAWPQEES